MLGSTLTYFTKPPVRIKLVNCDFRGRNSRVEVFDFLGTDKHDSDSFGLQWAKYRDVQIDRFNASNGSYKHLQTFMQGDLSVLNGAVCVEIGSGAGRFTDYLVDLCKTVITVDSSPAIFVNVALGAPNLLACRADLFEFPIRREKVDMVFCRGVLQHTRSPRKAIGRLFDYVRPGGLVLFDMYPLKWYTPFVVKYWLRPFTKQVSVERFTVLAEKWVPRLLKFKSKVINRILPKNIVGINLSNQIVPIADFSRAYEIGSWEQQVRWSVLETVDMYTPRYDRPMTFRAVLRALKDRGAREIQADPSSFCFKAVAPQ